VSVTIMVQRRVRPGQDTARVAAALRSVEEHTMPRPHRRLGQLFRGLDDPQLLWYVAEWDSRAAYEARPSAESAGALDALCIGEARRYHFEQFWFTWNMSIRTIMWDGTLVHAPSHASPAVRACLQTTAGEQRGLDSGQVEGYLYQELDHAHQFLILRGWESPSAWEHFARERWPALHASLRRFDASAVPFIQLTLLEYDRLVTAGP
jgi:hypothetical protein